MDKKGMGLKIAVGIIVLLVSFAIVFYLVAFEWKPWVEKEVVPATTCRLSVIQAGTWLGQKALKKEELPKLRCPKIPVEIEGETQEEIMKELMNLMIKVSHDFGATETFSRASGRYCRRRYHPVTFKKKNFYIHNIEEKFKTSLEEAYKLFKLVPKFPREKVEILEEYLYIPPIFKKYEYLSFIDTNKEYSILFVADYERGLVKWINEAFTLSFMEERLIGENEAVALVESDKIIGLNCHHLI